MEWKELKRNPIVDGVHRVSASTNNPIVNDLINNVEWLKEQIDSMSSGQGALTLFSAPLETTADYLVGGPVYLGDGSDAKVFLPGETITDDQENGPHNWAYGPAAMATGVIKKIYYNESGNPSTADIVISGYSEYDLVSDGSGGSVMTPFGDDAAISTTRLQDLFDDDVFDLDVDDQPIYTFASLKSGVLYLSTTSGKLSSTSSYTRVMAVLSTEIRIIDGDPHNLLRFYVCPEGFSGDRFHSHSFYTIDAGSFGRTETPYNALPSFPEDWEMTGRIVDHPSSATIPGQPSYPLTDLAIGYTPSSNPDGVFDSNDPSTGAGILYNLFEEWPADTDPVVSGWLSTQDPYFDDVRGDIPAGSTFGYTVKLIERFQSDNPEKVWSPPVDPKYIILSINGQPESGLNYVINDAGIWWLSDDYNSAPFPTHDSEIRVMRLWYVDAEVRGADSFLKDVESSEFYIDRQDGGSPNIVSQRMLMGPPLVPSMPFNTEDDLIRATDPEVMVPLEGLGSHKVVTPALVATMLQQFSSLTQLGTNREATVSTSSWDQLTSGGIFKMQSQSGAPVPFSGYMLCFSARVEDGKLIQMAFEHEDGYIYTRASKKSGAATTWTQWRKLTVTDLDNESTAGAMRWNGRLKYRALALVMGDNGIIYQAAVNNPTINPIADLDGTEWHVWVSNRVDMGYVSVTGYDGEGPLEFTSVGSGYDVTHSYDLTQMHGDTLVTSNIREVILECTSSCALSGNSAYASYGSEMLCIHRNAAYGGGDSVSAASTVSIPINPGVTTFSLRITNGDYRDHLTVKIKGFKQALLPGSGAAPNDLSLGSKSTIVVTGDADSEYIALSNPIVQNWDATDRIEPDASSYPLDFTGVTQIVAEEVRSVRVKVEIQISHPQSYIGVYGLVEAKYPDGTWHAVSLCGLAYVEDVGSAVFDVDDIPVNAGQLAIELRLCGYTTSDNSPYGTRSYTNTHIQTCKYTIVGVTQRVVTQNPLDTGIMAVPTGATLPFAGVLAPNGYLLCNGQLCSAAQYPDLYAVIGVMYGTTEAGNFRVPDMRGRVLRMIDIGAGIDKGASARDDRGDGATGDVVGTTQAPASNGISGVKSAHATSHTNPLTVPTDGTWSNGVATGDRTGDDGNGRFQATQFKTDGIDTRMANMSTMYIIKT